jgi:hypothetical protein
LVELEPDNRFEPDAVEGDGDHVGVVARIGQAVALK